jgi:hypothetical protein
MPSVRGAAMPPIWQRETGRGIAHRPDRRDGVRRLPRRLDLDRSAARVGAVDSHGEAAQASACDEGCDRDPEHAPGTTVPEDLPADPTPTWHHQGMELVERELLEAVARDPADQAALSVLADYWIGYGDARRGALVQLCCGDLEDRIDLADEESRLNDHVATLRAPLLAAGYRERDLALDRGLLQFPLAASHDLDADPALFRLSPRVYRIDRELASSADLRVDAATVMTPMGLGRERVAIKSSAGLLDGELDLAAWLEFEHSILRRIRHPNVVETLGWAVTRTGRGLVTRWGGIGLDALLTATREYGVVLGSGFALSVAVQLCDALEAVHRADVVHGSLRPDHVLLAEDGTVTVIDFGFAFAEGARPDRYATSPGPRRRIDYGYLSPEAAMGYTLDPRSDLFSAAMIAAELVDGQHPIRDRGNDFELLVAIRDGRWTLPAMSPPVAQAFRFALVRREDRFESATEMRNTLVLAAGLAGIPIGPHVIAQRLCELGVAT